MQKKHTTPEYKKFMHRVQRRYVEGGWTLKELADYYDVPLPTLEKRSKRESWFDKRDNLAGKRIDNWRAGTGADWRITDAKKLKEKECLFWLKARRQRQAEKVASAKERVEQLRRRIITR